MLRDLHDLIITNHTSREKYLIVSAKTNHIETTAIRNTMKKQFQCIKSKPDSISHHRSTSIQEEYVFRWLNVNFIIVNCIRRLILLLCILININISNPLIAFLLLSFSPEIRQQIYHYNLLIEFIDTCYSFWQTHIFISIKQHKVFSWNCLLIKFIKFNFYIFTILREITFNLMVN